MSSWAESAANKLLTALGCVGPKLEAVFGLPHFGLRGTRNCAKKGLCFRTLVSRVFGPDVEACGWIQVSGLGLGWCCLKKVQLQSVTSTEISGETPLKAPTANPETWEPYMRNLSPHHLKPWKAISLKE